mgnify:CR=1 FL=1
MSNSCNQTPTISNTAEIVENERPIKLSPLRWSSLEQRIKKGQYMNKKLLISQSIMWAAAILVVSIVDEKQFAISMLVILATVSLMNLRKGK